MCKINKSPGIGNRPDHQNYRKMVTLSFVASIDKKKLILPNFGKIKGFAAAAGIYQPSPGARYQWLPPLVVVGLIANDFPKIVKNDCIGIVPHRSDYCDCKSFLLIY